LYAKTDSVRHIHAYCSSSDDNSRAERDVSGCPDRRLWPADKHTSTNIDTYSGINPNRDGDTDAA
jgi:hypothetical protein